MEEKITSYMHALNIYFWIFRPFATFCHIFPFGRAYQRSSKSRTFAEIVEKDAGIRIDVCSNLRKRAICICIITNISF